MDAGIVLGKSPDGVVAFQYDGGVARTVDARPRAVGVVSAVDGHAVERHGGSVGNGNLHVLAECAGDDIAVICHNIAGQYAEVNGTRRASRAGHVGEWAGADGPRHSAADGDGAARASKSCADAVGGTLSLGGGHLGHTAGDGDVATRA